MKQNRLLKAMFLKKSESWYYVEIIVSWGNENSYCSFCADLGWSLNQHTVSIQKHFFLIFYAFQFYAESMLVYNTQKAVFNRALSLDIIFDHEEI